MNAPVWFSVGDAILRISSSWNISSRLLSLIDWDCFIVKRLVSQNTRLQSHRAFIQARASQTYESILSRMGPHWTGAKNLDEDRILSFFTAADLFGRCSAIQLLCQAESL